MVLVQASRPLGPGVGLFDHPSLGQDDEAGGDVEKRHLTIVETTDRSVGRMTDHVNVEVVALVQVLGALTVVAAVHVEFMQQRVLGAASCHHRRAAIAILAVGGLDENSEQEAERVDKDVTFASHYLLAGIGESTGESIVIAGGAPDEP